MEPAGIGTRRGRRAPPRAPRGCRRPARATRTTAVLTLRPPTWRRADLPRSARRVRRLPVPPRDPSYLGAFLELLDGLRTDTPSPMGSCHSDFLLAEATAEIVGRRLGPLRAQRVPGATRAATSAMACCRRSADGGVATEILRQSPHAGPRARGVDRSSSLRRRQRRPRPRVIERCGGVLESVVPERRWPPYRRYWSADVAATRTLD